jgi:hypothetical protein
LGLGLDLIQHQAQSVVEKALIFKSAQEISGMKSDANSCSNGSLPGMRNSKILAKTHEVKNAMESVEVVVRESALCEE